MPQLCRSSLRLLLLLLVLLAGRAGAAESISAVTIIEIGERDARGELALRLSALGQEFELALAPSAALADVSLIAAELADARFYAGEVIGDPQGWARFTEHAGQFTGLLRAWGRLYRISEDDSDALRSAAGSSGDTVIIDITDHAELLGDGSGSDRVLIAPPPAQDFTATATASEPRANGDSLRVLHIAAVVDTLYDEHYAGTGALRALSVLNGVDGLYREELGLALHISVLKLLTDPTSDPMRASALSDASVERLLEVFTDYRRGDADLPDELGAVHLFSGANDARDVIGLAWKDTVCDTRGYDTSVATPFYYDVLLSAHELGHTLGAEHDDVTACAVQRDQLMWPIFTPQMQAHFSSCSLDAISARLGAACLDDDLDLGIALSSDRETLIRGDIAHVQLHAENHDLHNFAHGVRAAFQLPASLGSTALPPDCSERQGLIDCALGDLAPHSGVLMELNLHAVAVGTADVAAFLSADGVYDFNGSDNSQQLRLTVLDAPIADDDGGGGGALHWITLGGLWLALRRPDPRSRR